MTTEMAYLNAAHKDLLQELLRDCLKYLNDLPLGDPASNDLIERIERIFNA